MDRKRIYCLANLLLLILLAGPFLPGCDNQEERGKRSSVSAAEPENGKTGKIVALGDSLTAGLGVDLQKSYPLQLQKKLQENGYDFRVVNAGVSGETSSGTLSRLDWILGQNPEIIILEIGANDGLRGIDPALVKKNIDEILTKLQGKDIVTILAGMQMVWNLGEQYTLKFNAIYPELAREHNVIFMPFFLEDVAAEASLNREDGIHPNEEGYRHIVRNIYPYVVQAIEKLHSHRPSG
ncbi:arylesterase [Desulfopila inferna]|nr:arylesterase [Desulfopila inferna]